MKPRSKAAAKAPRQKRTQRSQALKFVFTVIKILTIFFVSASCIIGGIVIGAIYGYIKTTVPIQPDQLDLKNLTSFVYDSKGKEIYTLKGEQNRILVDGEYIPENLGNAFIAIEDKRFKEHHGIDLVRISSAVYNFLKPGGSTHGGSTITQQLVRNITGDTRITLKRKVQEQWAAIQLEKHISKEKILNLYMNLIFMGGNYYGVESASKAYFGKSVKDLSLAQCASLAGITNSPSWYAPTSEKTKKKNKERQEIILKEMRNCKFITEAEYQQALKEDLKFVEKNKNSTKASSSQSYFVDQVVNEVRNDLVATGISAQAASKMIYNNGLKIYTTMDSDMQKAMDDVFTNEKNFPIFNKRLEHPQAAMVIIDPATGQVKALRGGYGQKTIDLSLNRATQIHRPPGSTFKPIAVYGPAIDQGIITPATVIDDAPTYLLGVNKGLYPQNYDKNSYGGLTTIHNAIIKSTNVVAAKVWTMLKVDLSHKYLKRDGIILDKQKDSGPSIAMGGLNTGVNTLDMAAAYVPFINNGKYIQPSTYTRVEDKEGNVILEKKPKTNIVYDNEGTSYVMTNMLKDVVRTGGTAEGRGQIQNGKMPSAGKTGTTSDNKDKWFVGYTPYYVGATWYGYDKNNKLVQGEYSQALIIWKAVMEKVHANLQPKPFPTPKGTVKKVVCRYSGKAPSDLCSRDPRGNAVIEELFVKGTEPKDDDVCDVHVLASVCKDSKDAFKRSLLFGDNCPASSMLEQVFTKRKTPYVPVKPDDPYPADWLYELPADKYCNVHGSQGQNIGSEIGTGDTIEPTTSPGTSDTGNTANIDNPVDPANGVVNDVIGN